MKSLCAKSFLKKRTKHKTSLTRYYAGIISRFDVDRNQEINENLLMDRKNETISQTSEQNKENEEQNLIKKENIPTNLIKELNSNLGKNKFFIRYSPELYQLSWILYLTSPKCYKILRQLLPFPNRSILYNKFGKDLAQIKRELTDLNEMRCLLNLYYSTECELIKKQNNKIIVSLCIDAFYFRSFQGLQGGSSKKYSYVINESAEDEIMNNGFIFLLAPLTPKIPSKIVHIETSPNGSYDEQISEISKIVFDQVQNCGFRIWFKATDGDSGLHEEHKIFFNTILNTNFQSFSDLISKIYNLLESNDDMSIPIADPLHVFKNIRARLLNHKIAVTIKNQEEAAFIDLELLKNVLNIGKVLDDTTQIGKMRDEYPLKLFTFGNIIKLVENELYPEALLFFPYCCWIASIYAINIDLELRFFLVELAFHLFYQMLTEIPILQEMNINQRGTEAPVVFTEELYVIRNINTLVAFGVAFIFGDDEMRMNALGTHLVENSIGLARQDSSDPRWERILTSFSHAEMRKRFAFQHGIKLYVQGRLNDGGCKLPNAKSETLVRKNPEWRVENFIQCLFGCCRDDVRECCKDLLIEMIQEIKDIVGELDLHEYSCNDAVNSSIMARIISFSKKKT